MADMKNIVLAAVISAIPTALQAQDGNKADRDDAADIVVTATAIAKFDVPFAETPQNIAVITQDTFERQNATSVEEMPSTSFQTSPCSTLRCATISARSKPRSM